VVVVRRVQRSQTVACFLIVAAHQILHKEGLCAAPGCYQIPSSRARYSINDGTPKPGNETIP
jgi:hypothetical protein